MSNSAPMGKKGAKPLQAEPQQMKQTKHPITEPDGDAKFEKKAA